MTFNHFLLMGLGPPHLKSNSHQPAGHSILTKGNSHIEITFDGHTRRYDNINDCQFTERDKTQFWYLDVGSGSTTYLSIALYGDCSGSFQLGYSLPEQYGLGIVTYASNQFIYSSYGSTAWLTPEPLLTQGQVTVERFDRDRLAELTFTGTLLPLGGVDNPVRTIPISGHVYLNRSQH
ncbi:hypothetical protein [Spirosoma fluminis]